MKCPHCNSSNSIILDSRYLKGKIVKTRKRHCNTCLSKFNTVESNEDTLGELHAFHRNNLNNLRRISKSFQDVEKQIINLKQIQHKLYFQINELSKQIKK